jgi:cleavage and polyadenylation specificity factor subunit 3
LDHCAAVPYVVGHTNFKGRILMTHPTKAITATLLRDFVRVARAGGGADSAALFTDAHLDAAMARTEVIDFHAATDVDGIRVTAHRAGHVLGAAMFEVEVAGLRLLYTGDYSRAADRHLPAADLPAVPPHVLIVEATYGVSRHVPRPERERRFLDTVTRTLRRGGRVLLPVVALGRAQELLLILEEHWAAHPELHGIPVYQASGLARRAMSVYQTYIESMNDAVQAAFRSANPFVFRHVTHLRGAASLDGCGPCVVLATPSMLQSGLSRDLFEAWCEDARNGVIIADFAVSGTLAREILGAPDTVLTRAGGRVPLRASVDAISFSAHADFDQTAGFVDALAPRDVVLVHGEATEMMRLKRALEARAAAGVGGGVEAGGEGQETKGGEAAGGAPPPPPPTPALRRVYAPKVGQPVHIRHAPSHAARLVGSLAEKPPAPGARVRGLLVRRAAGGPGAPPAEADDDGACVIVAPGDLGTYTQLVSGAVTHRQALALAPGVAWAEVRLALELMFEGAGGRAELGGVTSPPAPSKARADSSGAAIIRVGGCVDVEHAPGGGPGGGDQVVLTWAGGPGGDLVADAVVAVTLAAAGEPPAARAAEGARSRAAAAGDAGGVAAAEAALLTALLAAQFGDARAEPPAVSAALPSSITVTCGGCAVAVDVKSGVVREASGEEGGGAAAALADRVGRAAKRVRAALRPLAGAEEDGDGE